MLSKADADSRGGAALSVRAITGKPIKFLGVGEKTDALEPFYPDRIASRRTLLGRLDGDSDDHYRGLALDMLTNAKVKA